MTASTRGTFITFETRETTKDPNYGTTVEEKWVKASDAWAEVQDVLPSRAESIDESLTIQRRPARIRIDYFDGIGVTADMRIDIDARKLRIVSGPAEKGRRKEWEMMAEELSTEGHEP